MKLVAVDGFALNPGDLNWDNIYELGDLQLYERTDPQDVLKRCSDADIIITNKVVFDRNLLSNLPKLKLICVSATGFNSIDTAFAREKGIAVCNVPDYSSWSVAQHTFAFILEFATQVALHSQSVHKGDWVKSKDFSYSLTPLIELYNKTLGVVGLGNIGLKVAEIGRAFGMRVIYHTPSPKDIAFAEYKSLEDVFSESDFVSLHLPLTTDNSEFVNRDLISKMKPSGYLLNTSRGQLVNEADLAACLNEGILAGAGLDVLSVEPPKPDNPLLCAKNCLITPHNAWMSKEARRRIMDTTYANIKAFVEGSPLHIVN